VFNREQQEWQCVLCGHEVKAKKKGGGTKKDDDG